MISQLLRVTTGALLLLASLVPATTAQQDDVTRGIIPDYLKKRPVARRKTAPPRRENNRVSNPEPKTSEPRDDSNDSAMVGVTVWRVRPAGNRSNQVRLSLHH